ncbi:MAG: hypothetical protein EPO13_06755 [Actinomycetota bacterium]|nr:MAG: hypothetical protein EPO13_06755 [Actinomycetota bacterium]
MKTKQALLGPALVAFLAALLLTGCAGQQSTTASTPSGSSQSASTPSGSAQPGTSKGAQPPDGQAYAQCMRDHDVEMADPDPATGLPKFGDGVNPSSPAVQQAMKACQDLLPSGARKQAGDQKKDSYLAFSQCMRDNGLPDFPDPQPGSDKGVFGDTGVDRNDPAFHKAAQACQHILGGEG